MPASDTVDPSYTVFIRLPFPREDFINPPAVDWDAVKDKLLWKILSKASKSSDIDWNEVAEKFQVSLPFVLQQAAWLYERQLSQVRAQMRRVGASKSSAQSPVPGTESAGGETMRRTGSGGGGPRAPSSTSTRKDSPIPKNDGSASNTPSRSMAPPLSRTSSANTIHGRPITQTSPRPIHATLHRLSMSPPSNVRPAHLYAASNSAALSKPKDASSSEAADSSSSESDSEPAESRLLRRPPRFSAHKMGRTEDADDEDDTPAFLPFSTPSGPMSTPSDPSATLRGDPTLTRRTSAKKSTEVTQQSQTSDSSASSTAPTSKLTQKSPGRLPRPSGPLSPRRTAELAGRSPIGKGKNMGRDGSDGTPSMGSSFSDLDDASVTQSALEEALASNMQQGGMASRMSTISQALRSRYL